MHLVNIITVIVVVTRKLSIKLCFGKLETCHNNFIATFAVSNKTDISFVTKASFVCFMARFLCIFVSCFVLVDISIVSDCQERTVIFLMERMTTCSLTKSVSTVCAYYDITCYLLLACYVTVGDGLTYENYYDISAIPIISAFLISGFQYMLSYW